MKNLKKYLSSIRNSPMYSELVFILKWSAFASLIAFFISILWGFDITMLFGLMVGYAYLVFSYTYLAGSICAAVGTSDKSKAKKQMFGSYMLRYIGLFLLCWLAFELKIINVVGILLPQLFPKITIWIHQIIKRGKGNGRT